MITATDLQFFYSQVIDETDSNGGILTALSILSASPQNTFPAATPADRANGAIHYRKCFAKNQNQNNEALINPKFWLDTITQGDDWVVLIPGTPTDTKGDLDESRIYSCAEITATANAGQTDVTITVEDVYQVGAFLIGDLVVITDKPNPTAVSGNLEFAYISSVAVNGNEITITLTGNLLYNYAIGARCASVLEGDADMQATASEVTVTSTAGTYDDTTYPILVDNQGTLDETITCTFTSATDYTVVGSVSGNLGTGNTTDDFTPLNPAWNRKLFSINSTGFGGTFATNDTLVFTTVSASQALWRKRVIPAGCDSLSNNSFNLVQYGDTA